MRSCGLSALIVLTAWLLGRVLVTNACATTTPAVDATIGVDAKAVRPAAQQDDGTEAIVRRAEQAWFLAEWKHYKARFVAPDGRVVDNGNGGVSHSEGQGYGMLLATFAEDAQGFATIWGWTEQHMFVRSDWLAAWKWDEKSKAIVDRNNATDGDLLMAWALARAAALFNNVHYRERAEILAKTIGQTLVISSSYGPVLLPGAYGFRAENQPDGPVVNLSYWVFPAFDALKPLAPRIAWDAIKAAGLRLVEKSRFGPLHLPSDWISLSGNTLQPAKNFPPTFGYDAIRIPLYLAAIGDPGADAGRFATLWNEEHPIGPFVIEVTSGSPQRPMTGAGFRLVAALSRCIARGTPVPPQLIIASDDSYYPATLRLLCMALIEEKFPECL